MIYIKENNRIVIKDVSQFNIVQILECGQIFRFQIDGDCAVVFSLDKFAKIKTYKDRVEVQTDDVDYFENFFDLKTDYNHIKSVLKKDEFLSSAVDYGYGIRILKNDLYEMIISFIISANNNILRIKKSINCLCEKFRTKCKDYYAFPTLAQLRVATIEDFVKAGLGYRASQMYSTIRMLTEEDIKNLNKTLDLLEEDDDVQQVYHNWDE